MAEAEKFILRPRPNPRHRAVMRNVLAIGAVAVGLFGWHLSTYDIIPAAGVCAIYGAALLDLALAWALPSIIEKHLLARKFAFFNDRLEILVEGAGDVSTCVFVLRYDNIESVEEAGNAADRDIGLTAVRLRSLKPIRVPRDMAGGTHRIVLPCLAEKDAPFERIKELVEKSRPA
ncbi:MAG: hypothetical protein GC185_05715 [Alphaproteobacteria bacterium]|nr:hypothetical protein [Alphaproteobacteria bacterium]